MMVGYLEPRNRNFLQNSKKLPKMQIFGRLLAGYKVKGSLSSMQTLRHNIWNCRNDYNRTAEKEREKTRTTAAKNTLLMRY